MRVRLLLFVALIGLNTRLASVTNADNWPTLRGPAGTGVAADAKYPVEFGKQQHLLWAATMPSHAGSTPIVWNDRVFMTVAQPGATEDDPGNNLARCLDLNGKELWTTELGKQQPGKHKKASGCNSSPVTDGKRQLVYFNSGDIDGVELGGKVLWRITLKEKVGEDTLRWD